ncbi:hypothetical protein [Streptomyces sp. NL15-2K]|uniref:hypothetical protein n=1 Tax=Streptomyces sp. NL15-2K TaxID=376149 RepID=UPI000FF92482|nr:MULTISPECIES: hypothetical protein [Actinomycetes]WKX08882.1 hypothetical protein Q4V64_15835 [Kutzneria buriramensis]GCB49626.1 hypothetical protein SNL152K_6968 [Streptomyces sp. NL15-2K]
MTGPATNALPLDLSTMRATAHTPTAYGYCCWHGEDAEDVRLIDVLEQGSGGRAPALFACPPCRETHRLVPLADRP